MSTLSITRWSTHLIYTDFAHFRLEQLELHSSTERLVVVAAILRWCPRLLTVNLPEFDLLSETLHSAAPLHYTNNFLLPCLFLQHKYRNVGRPSGLSSDALFKNYPGFFSRYN